MKEFANRKIILNAIKVTELTNKMFKIMSTEYEKVIGFPLNIGNLGNSTNDFNFFVTESIKSSISQTQSLGSSSLINKLITLSSKSEYQIVDSIMSRIQQKT